MSATPAVYRVGGVLEEETLFEYTVDPEEAAGEKLARDVFDHDQEDRLYEITLQFDPDGYFGGKLRRWRFAVESRDPRFAPRRFIRDIVEQSFTEAVESGETTGWVDDRARRVVVPQLGRRDRVVAESHDGERRLVYEQPSFRFR